MRVLLTGHKGYIGTVLVPMLLDADFEVVGLDSDLYRSCTFGDDFDFRIDEKIKDVRDVKLEDLKGFDAVLHLAGLSNDPLGDLNPELTEEINFKASVNLAKLAKKAGVKRFVFSSSCSNYGAGGQDMLDENSALNPVTPYGKSKVNVEKEVSRLADDHFSPVFLRNATAYGVSPRLRFDLVLNNLVAWAYTTGKVYLKSDGMSWRPIVHIRDISQAFIAVLQAEEEKIHNATFNVGRTEENYLIRDIAQLVREIVPGSVVEFADSSGPDKRNYKVNCDKIVNTLPGFKPAWTVRKGAEELYKAYQEIGLRLEDFEGPKYRRISHIQQLLKNGLLKSDLRWRKRQLAVGGA